MKALLIGGPPGAGKTTLGRAIAAELGFGSLTVDDLALSARVLTTPETHPALHQMRPLGHIQYFTETGPDQLIADAIALEETMWPAVKRVIRSHIGAKSPIVIDWWLLLPDRVAAVADDAVTSIWLHVDLNVLEERERRLNAEFWAESTDPELMLSNFMERSRWRNELVASQAAVLDMSVLHQPSGSTEADLVERAMRIVRRGTVKWGRVTRSSREGDRSSCRCGRGGWSRGSREARSVHTAIRPRV